MCLQINGFKTREEAKEFKPSVAKKNIAVWKVVKKLAFLEYLRVSMQLFTTKEAFIIIRRKREMTVNLV